MDQTPAILGGEPVFDQKISIVRPVLPHLAEMRDGIEEILTSGMVTKGRHLEAFEDAVARHLGVKHAIGVSSCTSGLMLVYKGLGFEGREVIVPSFTFMATVSSLVWSGVHPVFIDVDPDTTNIDPRQVEAALTPQTAGIVAVHNFGNPAEIEALEALSARYGVKLVFDAAHGFGALYRGRPVGSQGDAQVFSLSPTKLLITGEGGIVATNDDGLADYVRMGREYGNNGSYDSAFAGLNARMPEFNALMGLYSLDALEEAARQRNEAAAAYHEVLGMLPGIGFQKVHPEDRNSYKDFSITVDEKRFGLSRDALAAALAAENIDTRKYYDPPVHRQIAYRHLFNGQSLASTDWLANNSLSLPIWSGMATDIPVRIGNAFRRLQLNAPAVQKMVSQDG